MLVRLKEDFAARELCLECRLLVFRHCAKRTQTRLCMSRVCECSLLQKAKTSANIQRTYTGTYNRTCEAILLQLEHLQIDELAELLGQLSCNTQVNVSKRTNACMLEHTTRLGTYCGPAGAWSN